MISGLVIAAALVLVQNQASAPGDVASPADLAVCAIAASAVHERLSQREPSDQAALEVLTAVRDHAMTRLESLDPTTLESAETAATARVQAMRVGAAVEAVGNCALRFGLLSDDR